MTHGEWVFAGIVCCIVIIVYMMDNSLPHNDLDDWYLTDNPNSHKISLSLNSEVSMISVNMVDAIRVQFLKSIFEEDFVEKGMKAWLTDIEWDEKGESYKLYFDFTDFEAENQKYFKETYYANGTTRSNPNLPEGRLYTAQEAGQYTPKYSVYFSVEGDKRDDEKFKLEILKYLREVN